MCVIQAVGGTMTGRLRLKRQCPLQADTWDMPSLRSVKWGRGYCWWRITSSCSPSYKPEAAETFLESQNRRKNLRFSRTPRSSTCQRGKSGSSDGLGLQLSGSGAGRGFGLLKDVGMSLLNSRSDWASDTCSVTHSYCSPSISVTKVAWDFEHCSSLDYSRVRAVRQR